MKILFHLGHPAHFHLFKNIIISLKNDHHQVIILIKKKDILEDLLKESAFEYVNILPKGRKDGKIGIAIGIIKRDLRLFKFCITNRPNLLIGTSAEIGHVGTLLNIPSINVNEDDVTVINTFAKISYPWNDFILSPIVCNNVSWQKKTIPYNGYHELAYLHPNNFEASKSNIKKYITQNEVFFLIRFAQFNAHHDNGISGINTKLAIQIFKLLEPYGKIYITSERELEPEFEKYRISINYTNIHHILAFATLYIGDSQTMAAEAGVLGIPFIRFNDFVGRIGYLNELENKYKLGFGFKTDQTEEMLLKIKELLKMKNIKQEWNNRRRNMLSEKIDVAKFMTWFIEDYPKSVKIMKENPDYQYRFR